MMLSALILIPLIGALVISLWPQKWPSQQVWQVTLLIQGLSLGWAGVIAAQFDIQQPNLQFVESLPWIETLGLTYQLGVDGLSMPLLLINSLLGGIAVYASSEKKFRVRVSISA